MKILIDGQTLKNPEMRRGIGIAMLEVVEEMIKQDFTNEFFIALYDPKDLSIFSSFAQSKLRPLLIDNHTNLHDKNSRNNQLKFTNSINKHIKQNQINYYWTPNPLMDNVFLPAKTTQCTFAATILDLIPLVLQDIYFALWPKQNQETYLQKIKLLQSDYDIYFHDSHYTYEDFDEHTQTKDKLHVVTPFGINKKFTPYPFKDTPENNSYILYVGGMDPRKNMIKALEAFALFIANHKDYADIKLYLTCNLDQTGKQVLEDAMKRFKISTSVQCTGYVKETELIKLYQNAKGFFFPSLYEGVGLPVLEALACGIPVACSNTSSLPEIVDSSCVLFDPHNLQEMVDALAKIVKAPLDTSAREQRYQHSQQFSWSRTAELTLDALKQSYQKDQALKPIARKKIAWVSPLPPSQSGIAYYSEKLVQELKKHHKIDLYYEGEEPSAELKKAFRTLPVQQLSHNHTEYDEIIYHIGNNSLFHKETYKLAWNIPGTLVLHDYNIHQFLHHSFFSNPDEVHFYHEALTEDYGMQGEKIYQKALWSKKHDLFTLPLSRAIVKRSKRVIAHHMWIKDQFSDIDKITIIPLFAETAESNTESIKNLRTKWDITPKEFVISCLGFVNPNKLPQLQVNVIVKLLQKGYPIKMIFAGEVSEHITAFRKKINNSEYNKNFCFTGYQSDSDYNATIALSDIVINLRRPSMGEGSATLMQSLAAGKACIVSDWAQYKEFPDDVCWKLPYENEEDILYKYIAYLLTHPEERATLGRNAQMYATKYLAIESLAKLYIKSN